MRSRVASTKDINRANKRANKFTKIGDFPRTECCHNVLLAIAQSKNRQKSARRLPMRIDTGFAIAGFALGLVGLAAPNLGPKTKRGIIAVAMGLFVVSGIVFIWKALRQASNLKPRWSIRRGRSAIKAPIQ
jgi:hypothetical protein